jgi:DNA repair photolyase
MVVVKETYCKSILNKCGIPSIDYSINPYRGCTHKCIYCYVQAMRRFYGHVNDIWGDFVDVKVNAATVLAEELKRAKKGLISISTATDPYQPVEKKYEITRKCLEQILKHDFPIQMLTKSSLVLRDIDLFKQFTDCTVGCTLTTLNDDIRKKYELYPSSVEERISSLQKLHEEGTRTYIFIAPVLPFITDEEENLRLMIETSRKIGVEYVYVDRLNLRQGVWKPLMTFLEKDYPELVPKYQSIFPKNSETYFEELKPKINSLCQQYGVKCNFCY